MDVVSEGIDDRGEVSGKDAGVKVKEVLKAVHVGPLHKVLPILQLGQQAIFLSQPETRPDQKKTGPGQNGKYSCWDEEGLPADQEVLFHCHQLMALTCHAAHLFKWEWSMRTTRCQNRPPRKLQRVLERLSASELMDGAISGLSTVRTPEER